MAPAIKVVQLAYRSAANSIWARSISQGANGWIHVEQILVDCQPILKGKVYEIPCELCELVRFVRFRTVKLVCEYVRVSLDTHIRTHTRTSPPLPNKVRFWTSANRTLDRNQRAALDGIHQ
jgi:hypothetical protein